MDAVQAPVTARARGGAGRLRTVVVLAVVAVLVAAAAWFVDQAGGGANGGSGPAATGGAPRVGQAPLDISATATDGSAVSLAALKGQPVWLTIGATWCPDCRAEATDLQAAYAKFHPQGLALVAIFDQEDAAAVTEYAKKVGWTFTMVPDPSGGIRSRYHAFGIPAHFFIGRDGTIRDVRVGRLTAADMEQLAASLVNG